MADTQNLQKRLNVLLVGDTLTPIFKDQIEEAINELKSKDELLSIVQKSIDDFCPEIKTCKGEIPDDDNSDCFPCYEFGAPCWFYENIYKPLKDKGFIKAKEHD